MAGKKKATAVVEQQEDMVRPPLTNFIETGCVGFDLAISNGLGLPEAGNILLFGNPGVGKSTLIADVLRRILVKYERINLPCRIVYIDSENSLSLLDCIGKDSNNPDELGLEKYITVVTDKSKGVEYKPQQLIYYPNCCTFTETEEIYTRYTLEGKEKENKHVKVIVVDSLTNLTSTTLAEAAVDKSDFGSNAKERVRFYGKWLPRTRECGITTIYTSQVRQKQGATAYEDPNRPAVTEADKHNMDVIMKLTKSVDSKRVALKKVKQKTIDGVVEVQTRYILKLDTSRAAHTKNRIWKGFEVETLVKHGNRILNSYTIFNILEANSLYKKVDANTFKVSPELLEAFPDIPFGDKATTEGIAKRDLNILTSSNMGRLLEYLKNNDIYKVAIGEVEELDDGYLA